MEFPTHDREQSKLIRGDGCNVQDTYSSKHVWLHPRALARSLLQVV